MQYTTNKKYLGGGWPAVVGLKKCTILQLNLTCKGLQVNLQRQADHCVLAKCASPLNEQSHRDQNVFPLPGCKKQCHTLIWAAQNNGLRQWRIFATPLSEQAGPGGAKGSGYGKAGVVGALFRRQREVAGLQLICFRCLLCFSSRCVRILLQQRMLALATSRGHLIWKSIPYSLKKFDPIHNLQKLALRIPTHNKRTQYLMFEIRIRVLYKNPKSPNAAFF
jgi:hypothetical protein